MIEVTLTVLSAGRRREFKMERDRLVIGCAEGGGRGDVLTVEDDGLDARHASINREGTRVWVLDELSSSGTFLNGRRVPPQGTPLADGDQISAGDYTTIIARLRTSNAVNEHPPSKRPSRLSGTAASSSSPSSTRLPLAFTAVLSVLCLGLLAWMAFALSGGNSKDERRVAPSHTAEPTRPSSESTSPPSVEEARANGEPSSAASTPAAEAVPNQPAPTEGGGVEQVPAGAKTYLRMSREEQLQFLESRARHVSTLMGNRPYAFNEEVLGYIKQYVDAYARRVGNNAPSGWGADLRVVFARARTQYAPHIIHAFKARGVPPVVGLYIVMIETEYYNFPGENSARAAGLFQFIPGTAIHYGIHPSERTNVEKMAPAAAHYMSDRIAEFGPDSMSVALAIAGYNRNPDSVRRDLRDVIVAGGSHNERSFWTLVANSTKLDHWFQGENIKYVPKFFAAAIVGETPWAFGLEMRKLSTYTSFETAAASPQTQTVQAATPSPSRSKNTLR